ncbi:MAG: hypothetical protein DMG73_08335 [Acidobacteria bacterium]|nr:MAG: hypothetical protein DMG73_08335 [Acidobacteriota bacterium]
MVNRAANALRQAANALIRRRSYLGAQYRRLRTKLGAPKAITAMAHRLARLVYRMLKHGQRYVDKGTEYYEQRYRNQPQPTNPVVQKERDKTRIPDRGGSSLNSLLRRVSGENLNRKV